MRLMGLKITYRGVIAEGFWDGIEGRQERDDWVSGERHLVAAAGRN